MGATHELAGAISTLSIRTVVGPGCVLVLPIVRIEQAKSRHPFSDWLYVRGWERANGEWEVGLSIQR